MITHDLKASRRYEDRFGHRVHRLGRTSPRQNALRERHRSEPGEGESAPQATSEESDEQSAIEASEVSHSSPLFLVA